MTIRFRRGKQQFEITRSREGCAGYVDGVLSATGPDAHTVTRVLLRKHVRGAPAAQIICLAPKQRAQSVEVLGGTEPDLAG